MVTIHNKPRKVRTPKPVHTWVVTLTDTRSGEPNWAWKREYDVRLPQDATRRSIIQACKAAAGWSGLPTQTYEDGSGFTLRPFNMAQVMFIELKEQQ